MQKKKPKTRVIFYLVIIFAAFVFTILTIITRGYVSEGYELSVGMVSPKRFVSAKTMLNKVATDSNRQFALSEAEKMLPVYKRDDTITDRVLANMDSFIEKAGSFWGAVNALAAPEPPVIPEKDESQTSAETEISKNNTTVWQQNNTNSAERSDINSENEQSDAVDSDESASDEMPAEQADPSEYELYQYARTGLLSSAEQELQLTSEQAEYLVSMDPSALNEFFDALRALTVRTLDRGLSEIDQKTLANLRDELSRFNFPILMSDLAYDVIYRYMELNILPDQTATDKAKEDRAKDYDEIYYLQNQTIVDANEIINGEQFAALEALGFIRRGYIGDIAAVAGVAVVTAMMFVIAILYIYLNNRTGFAHPKEVMLLFTVYAAVLAFSSTVGGLKPQFEPILFFAMIIAILIDARLSIALTLCFTVICALGRGGDAEFLMYYSISGVFAAMISRFSFERNRIMLVGALIIAQNFLLSMGLALIIDKEYSNAVIYESALYSMAGIVSLIICVGSLPIWEAVFGIVTQIRLLDLLNPNNPLMRILTIETPGTFNHSLIVANLAETAAFDIGANPNIARVGGYYHDIGKLKYPQYFAENQFGENPHDLMDPFDSVEVIKKHVTHGAVLAQEYKLPKVIRDIIVQHHGNTLIKYFFHKYKKANPDANIKESDFRYGNPIPDTKESAIVMLADTVEAAVRSVIPAGKTMDEIEEFIHVLIKDKLNDEQLNDCQLTFSDLKVIEKSFMRVFVGMYHARIPYPSKTGDGSSV